MQASFGRRYLFSASHRLHTDRLSLEANREAYGKCNNPHGHGHNYVVEVVVTGEVNPVTGFVVDLPRMDEQVQQRVLNRFDHRNLNLDPKFVNLVPTTENLCRAIFEDLDGHFSPAELERVRVEETENNFFECVREGK